MVSSGDPRVPAWLSPQPFLVVTCKYVRAELWHPGSTKAGELQEEAENSLMEENLLWSTAVADMQQHPSLHLGNPSLQPGWLEILLPIPSRMELQRKRWPLVCCGKD